MYTAVTILLILFCILGAFDGLYFHIIKYKLHLIPEAQKEHAIHTLRAFVFAPLSLLLFVFNTGGLLLYAGILFVLFDAYLELIDILEEKKSRAALGGISPAETAVHIFASSFKFGAVLLLLATKDISSYSLGSTLVLEQAHPLSLSVVGGLFALGSVLGGVYSKCPELKAQPCPVRRD